MSPQTREQLRAHATSRFDDAARHLLEDDDTAAASDKLTQARLAEELLHDTRRPPKQLYVLGITTLVCLTLVGLAWSIHKPSNPLLLEVESESVGLRLGREWLSDSLGIRADKFMFDNLHNVQAGGPGIDGRYDYLEVTGPEAVLDRLQVPADARMELHGAPKGFSLSILGESVGGEIKVRDAHFTVTGSDGFVEYELSVPAQDFPPESIRFSGGGSAGAEFRLNATGGTEWRLLRLNGMELDFNREDPPGSGRLVSSVLKGNLTFPQSGRKVELLEADTLQLQGVRSARLVLSYAQGRLKVEFQGEVDSIHGGPEGFVKNLTPTWLEYFYHHQQLAVFWSALVFLSGLLWKLRNFL